MKSDLDSVVALTKSLLSLIDESLESLTLILIELDGKVSIAFVEKDPKVKLTSLHIVKPLVDVYLDLIAGVRLDDSLSKEVSGELIGSVLVQDQFPHIVVILSVISIHDGVLLPLVLVLLHVLDEGIEDLFDVLLLLVELPPVSFILQPLRCITIFNSFLTMP
jgi:hypothetical protein